MAERSGILGTDLYQLAMMQAYLREGMTGIAAFEFFVRKLPRDRNFLIAAGMEQCLDYLENLKPTAAEIEWLRSLDQFDPGLLDALAGMSFIGDVDAVPEGTVVFADEPLLRVAAPLPVAQLVETRLINLLHFQTLIASKAARMVLAAPGKLLVDFGYRRAHGSEAGLLAARAAYVAGFDGTATVQAGMTFGIPLYGTMAHSFIQAHGSEEDAFLAFARARPQRLVLLIDTYDTERAAGAVARLASRLTAEGIHVHGVRIDSGDLAMHAHSVRAILDAHGLKQITIFASGGLDEAEIARLLSAGAPIDGFGVGTSLTTSADAPALDCAYKIQEYEGLARRKTSEGKATWPGRKQVFRSCDAAGLLAGDVLGLADELLPGEPLLQPVMRAGRRLGPPEPLDTIRARVRDQLNALPPRLRIPQSTSPVPVVPSPNLRALADEVDRRVTANRPPPAASRWEHFPHGSDIGIRGEGGDLAAALEQAAIALTAIVTDPGKVAEAAVIEVACEADTVDALLYSWINAVIYEMSCRAMVFGRFDLSVSGLHVNARLYGERLDWRRHQPAAEPKGATYTALAVRRTEDGAWIAQCVVDV